MPIRPAHRQTLVVLLALLAVAAGVVALAEFGSGIAGHPGALTRLTAGLGLLVASALAAWRLARPPRSAATRTGRLVLFEAPLPLRGAGASPVLTLRGPRDAIERFIPLGEFEARFGGWALWAPAAVPTPELPGEALGVWSRRTCSRFRRLLRERGAVLEVRQSPGPAQPLPRVEARRHTRA